MSGVRKQLARLELALVNCVLCIMIIAGSVEAECNNSIQCMAPENSFIEKTAKTASGTCSENITFTCSPGFQSNGVSYTATCTSDGWEQHGSCAVDVLSLIIAAIVMVAIVSIFSLCMICLCKRSSKIQRKKFIYDTSIDTSEVIDGHLENGGVVNISMIEIQSRPKVIVIEDPDEMDDEAGSATPSDTTVPVDVHAGSDELVREDMLAGYGVIGDNPLTPTDLQAGSSTEHLIDMTRDEPDGQASIEPYGDGTIDRPLTRNRDLETAVGGSLKLKSVTALPSSVFTEKSASVRIYGPNDSDVDVNALYAKINRVKRASSRWPPGQNDKKPAVPTEGWNHIDDAGKDDKEKYPTEPATGERITEDMYAEVNHATRDSVRSSNEDPSTSKQIPPKVKPKSRKAIKHYTPPSGDHSALYARVDRSRHSSKSSILDSTFEPPSPPPIDGVDGLYAQIDRDRNSREDLSNVGDDDDDVRVK